MNYTRRANRPDANYYRETRRRGMMRASHGTTGRGRRSGGWAWAVLFLFLLLAAGAAAWAYFR